MDGIDDTDYERLIHVCERAIRRNENLVGHLQKWVERYEKRIVELRELNVKTEQEISGMRQLLAVPAGAD